MGMGFESFSFGKKRKQEKPKEENKEESTICKICGVNYKGMTYEQHEQRPFHQNCLE